MNPTQKLKESIAALQGEVNWLAKFQPTGENYGYIDQKIREIINLAETVKDANYEVRMEVRS